MVLTIERWLVANEARRTWGLSLLCALLLCARFRQGLLHAELWGEDGWVFYHDAYTSGIRCMVWPDLGYLHTFERLVALAAIWTRLPLVWTPTVFAIVGLGVQLAVAVFILSDRLEPIWRSWNSRAAFALLYIALPNSFETFGTLTNAQWHMALLAFLIVVSPPPANSYWRIFDAIVLALSSLSGPFCLFMLPFCFVNFWKSRSDLRARAEMMTRGLLVGIGSIVQAFFLLHGNRTITTGLGATPVMLARLISLNVVMGLLVGMRTFGRIEHMAWWQAAWTPVLIAVMAAFACMVAFWRGGYLFRTFSIYVAMLTTAELASPAVSATMQQWPAMLVPMAGQRYFLAPMLALLGALFVLAAQRSRAMRMPAVAALALVVCWAVPFDFIYVHQRMTDFDAKARAFEAAPPGTRVVLPEHPYGFSFVLVKKTH